MLKLNLGPRKFIFLIKIISFSFFTNFGIFKYLYIILLFSDLKHDTNMEKVTGDINL